MGFGRRGGEESVLGSHDLNMVCRSMIGCLFSIRLLWINIECAYCMLDNEYLSLSSIHGRLVLFTRLPPQEHRDLKLSLPTLHMTRLDMKKIDKVEPH